MEKESQSCLISPAVGMTMEDLAANLACMGVVDENIKQLSGGFCEALLTQAQQTEIKQAGCEVAVLPNQRLTDSHLQ